MTFLPVYVLLYDLTFSLTLPLPYSYRSHPLNFVELQELVEKTADDERGSPLILEYNVRPRPPTLLITYLPWHLQNIWPCTCPPIVPTVLATQCLCTCMSLGVYVESAG